MRKRFIENLIIGLALVSGAVPAFAGDGDRGNRDEMREQRQAPRQDRQRDARPAPPSADQRYPTPPQNQPQYQQPEPQGADGGRRGNRMSPEDRRALRRQIDQAGHDLYVPGR